MRIYHYPYSCNKCGLENEVKVTDNTDGIMCEAETICKTCGHKDYWSYGYFESGSEIESKCRKYICEDNLK